MRNYFYFIALCFIFGFHALSAQTSYKVGLGERPFIDLKKVPESAYEPGRFLIKIKPEYASAINATPVMDADGGGIHFGLTSLDALNQQIGVQKTKQYFYSPAFNNTFTERHQAWGLHLWYVMNYYSRISVKEIVEQYRQLPEVEVAEPVYKKHRIAQVSNLQDSGQENGGDEGGKSTNWTPNDPQFSSQWHYHNTGQQSGTADKDIDLPEAWEIEKGNSNVIVAIIDGGIQINHPDILGNLWSGIGYNFVNNNTTILADAHGTHVAGTVAAVNNNATGVAGIAGGSGSGDGVRLMSCQVFTDNDADGFHIAPVWAADNGASISQNSWGYDNVNVYNQPELTAIDYFNANGGGTALTGGITIFAAGNDNASGNWYPGCYTGAYGVAATNNKDQKAWYSNYDTWVDISAPGGETNSVTARGVLSTIKGSSYAYYQGTSMACPHVSGVAALVVSKAYGVLTNTQLKDILSNTTDNHYAQNPGYIGKLGAGRLNAHSALLATLEILGVPMQPATFTATGAGISQINLNWTKNSNNNDVLIVWAPTSTIGNPVNGTNYSVGQALPGGGTVLYKGSATSYAHTGLNIGTTFYYKAFSYDSGNHYSSGEIANASTSCIIYTPPFNESFAAGVLPTCWAITDNVGNAQIWKIGSFTPPTNVPALTAPYAYLDSDGYGSGKSQNSDLITPELNLSTFTSVNLYFKHFYRHFSGSTAKLSYSIDGGSTWTLITSWSATTANPFVFDQAITAVAGQASVKFKWNFTGTYGYYWAVDDIAITGSSSSVVLNVSPSNQNVTTIAGSTSFTVTSNASWTASSNQGWCTVTPSGNNNGTITATYTENTTASSRVATITVTAPGATPVNVTVTQAGAVLTPLAEVLLRPQQIDLSAATSRSAVLMKVSNYSSNDIKYRLYNGSNQYNCWDGTAFITSSSYSANPSIPGTPSTSSAWWIMFERGSNNSATASYRDRLGPSYGANYQTISLTAATAVSNPIPISGMLPLTAASYPFDQRYVVLAYDALSGGNLISATASDITTGAYSVVVSDGTVIKRLEVRDQLNVLMEQATGIWPSTEPITVFNLSGGGTYCDNGSLSGIAATLSGSENGVNYQLYQNGNPSGAAVAGTGSALIWNNLGAGTYTAKATKGATTVDMNGTVSVTVQSPVVPSVSFTASQNNVCQGTQVTFTASPINGGGTPSFAWTVNSVAAGMNSPLFTYNPDNGDVVGLTMTSSAGCVTVNPVSATPLTMTVNPSNTVSVTIVPDSNPVCSGTAVTFSTQPVNGGSAPAYQWKVNNQNVGTNSPTFQYVPTNGDHVETVLTSNVACATNNPATSNSVVMQVSTSVAASVSITANNPTVCQGQPVNLTAQPVNGGSNPVYHWYLNSQAVGTNSANYSFIPSSDDQVYVVMTSSLPCVTGSPATSGIFSPTVNLTVNASVSFTASQNNVCQGTQVTFTASPINGGGTPSFAWTVNSVAAGMNSPLFTYNPDNGDVVGLTMTSSAGCVTVNPVSATPLTMTVNPSNTVSVTIVPDSNPVCSGTAVAFSAQAVNGGPAPVFQWKVNNQNMGTNSPTFQYVPANGDHVETVLTSNVSCATNNPATSNTVVMQVSASVAASVNITANNGSPCQGQTVTFTAIPINGGNNPAYQWYVNNQAAGTNSANFSFIPQNGDKIQVKMTSSLVCVTNNPASSNVATITTNPVQLTLQAMPSQSGSVNMSGAPVVGQTVQLSAVAASGWTFVNWTDSQNQVLSSSATFNYTVTDCQNTITANFTSASQTSISGKLLMFNPGEAPLSSPYSNGTFYVQLFDGSQAASPPQAIQTNIAFTFNGLQSGKQYRLKIWDQPSTDLVQQSWSWNNWGGVTSVDALIVSYMSAGNPIVQNFPWIATSAEPEHTAYAKSIADANSSNSITALDALTLLFRTINHPESKPFPGGKPDFLAFAQKVSSLSSQVYPNDPEIQFQRYGSYTANSPASSVYQIATLPATVNGNNYFMVYYVPVGDMNASFVQNAGNKSQTLFTTTTHDMTSGRVLIEVASHLNVAAFNLNLQYDPALIEVREVQDYEIVYNNANEGLLSVAFIDQNGKELWPGDALMAIDVTFKRQPLEGEIFFKPVGNNSWADRNATDIPFVELSLPAFGTPNTGNLAEAEPVVMAYPNPFAEKTTLHINLPEAANVRLKLFNSLGKQLAEQEWNQAKGSHRIEISSEELSGKGVYLFEILISTPNRTSLKRGTLILVN